MNHEEFLATLIQELPPTQTKPLFSVEEIKNSFDESSNAWKENKKRKGHSYIYICEHVKKNGSLCKKVSFTHQFNLDLLCKWHFLDEQKRHKASVTKQVEECSPDLP